MLFSYIDACGALDKGPFHYGRWKDFDALAPWNWLSVGVGAAFALGHSPARRLRRDRPARRVKAVGGGPEASLLHACKCAEVAAQIRIDLDLIGEST